MSDTYENGGGAMDEDEMVRAFGPPRTSVRWTRDDGTDEYGRVAHVKAGLSCGDVVDLTMPVQNRANLSVQMRLHCPALPIGECKQQYPPKPLA